MKADEMAGWIVVVALAVFSLAVIAAMAHMAGQIPAGGIL